MNNLLSIVWYKVLPPVYGGQKGVALFNYYLGKERKLTCLCSSDNSPEENLTYRLVPALPSSRLQFWNPSVRKKILQLINDEGFDTIIIEHPYHAWLGSYKGKLSFRFIVHAHNIEYLRMRSRGKPWWMFVRRTEKKAFMLADQILFKTREDLELAINKFRIDPKKCSVVPYGVEIPVKPEKNVPALIRQKHSIHADEKILLFAGSPGYEPNVAAITLIRSTLVPLLRKKGFGFRVIICGGLEQAEIQDLNKMPEIVATGFVHSISDYFQAADCFINPVIQGSGVQSKNIEAIANGCPVVTTAFGATGLPAYLINQRVFVASDNNWEKFAELVMQQATGNQPVPSEFYKDFSWQKIIERMLNATGL